MFAGYMIIGETPVYGKPETKYTGLESFKGKKIGITRGGTPDIVLKGILYDAGYPFHFGTLTENLAFAALDERSEHEEVHPAFAREAREEGCEEAAALFERVAGVEKEHEIVFSYLRDALKEGTLYKRDKPTLWICSECGYRAATKEAWKVCPLCKAKQGLVEIPLPFDH